MPNSWSKADVVYHMLAIEAKTFYSEEHVKYSSLHPVTSPDVNLDNWL